MYFIFPFRSLVSLVLLLLFYADHLPPVYPLPDRNDRYFKSIPQYLRQNVSNKYFELTLPLPSDQLQPSCSPLLLQHDFGNTIGLPPDSVIYSPPVDCPGPWSHVVLEFRASCKGEQYDRIAGVWLDGIEILRTSTAEPTESGIFWNVRKDITRYSSLLLRSDIRLAVMLENIVNDVFTGVYHVNVSMLYYTKGNGTVVPSGAADRKNHRKLGFLKEKTVDLINKGGSSGISVGAFRNTVVMNSDGILGFPYAELEKNLGFISDEPVGRSNRQQFFENLYKKPADLIIPISDSSGEGFWFRIQDESDVQTKRIRIPKNTRRAVLEIYLSFHGNDEFWYSNPPDSYMKQNNITTGRGNGAFRQVFLTIDGAFVWSEVPFPVIFTGGMNPLFWEPVVAIGAFNLPSYSVDLTPYLGFLSDGKVHYFGLGVTDSIPFWLVDANLHLWLDPYSSSVQARSVLYPSPTVSIKRDTQFEHLDGSFRIRAKRKIRFSGWVNSAAGNFTTHVTQKFNVKNMIIFRRSGTYKEVNQKLNTMTELKVVDGAGKSLTRVIIRKIYPFKFITSTLPGSDNNTYLSITNISHALNEKFSVGDTSTSVSNSQDSWGWMVVKDHSVLSGAANTHQSLLYKDEFTRFSRSVAASNGSLLEDDSAFTYAPSS